MHARALSRLTLLVGVAAGAAACDARDSVRRLVGADASRAAVDSLIALRNEVEYLRAASAERDTLLQQVRETQDFIDSVDTGDDLITDKITVMLVPSGNASIFDLKGLLNPAAPSASPAP